MSKQRSLAVFAIAVIVVLATSVPAVGQAVYGSIIGTVTDPQGAAVPNAKITVTNVRKGTTDTATTNDSGNFSVTHLIPDTYNVQVEAQGFKTVQQKDIQVSADAAARVDSQFQLGSTTETVEVTSEAPQLKTDRADVATTFNERYVENLPVLGRNFTTFELLSPGTQKLTGWSHASTENPQGSPASWLRRASGAGSMPTNRIGLASASSVRSRSSPRSSPTSCCCLVIPPSLPSAKRSTSSSRGCIACRAR